MKKPILITCQPDDQYFLWQNHVYIESCLDVGFEEDKIHILLYKPIDRPFNKNWTKLKELYPKLNLHLYEDKGVGDYLGIYIPILRPHILWQHFEKFPELEKETIIYTDCDIVWTKTPDIAHLLEDSAHYMSNAASYMNYSYFERKNTEVLEYKKEDVKTRDFLAEICSIVGLDKKIVVENDNNIGGVQYVLKNVTASFWKKVEKDVLLIRQHLLNINKEFYESENKGIQSWCADLWAVIFNLWAKGDTVKIVPELNFTWSSDPISKIKETSILHNAGLTSPFHNGIPVMYKAKYINGLNPFKDVHLYEVYSDPESKTLANYYYLQRMFDVYNKYRLEY